MINEYQIFIRISQASVLIPLLIGVVNFKHLIFEQRLLVGLLSASLLTEIIAISIYYYASSPNNLPVYNLYAIVLFIFLNRIYAKNLKWKYSKPIWNALLIAFILFSIINLILYQSIYEFNSRIMVLSFGIYLILAVSYFIRFLSSSSNDSLFHEPMFWLNTGVMLYSSGALLLFLFINQILNSIEETIVSPWGLNAFLFLILNCFFAITIWIRKPKLSTPMS